MSKAVVSLALWPALLAAYGCGGASGESLTQEQEAYVNDAIDQASAMGELAASTSDVADPSLRDSNRFVSQLVIGECPEITLSLVSAVSAEVVLDFGGGCSMTLLPEVSASGSVSGTISLTGHGISITFDQLTIDDRTLDGEISGDATWDNGTVQFEVDVTLEGASQNSVDGAAIWTIERSSADITISEADLTVVREDASTYTILLSDLAMKPAQYENFIPESGTATLTIPNTGMGPATLTVEIEFTADSPVDHTVLVRIGNGPQMEYPLPTS